MNRVSGQRYWLYGLVGVVLYVGYCVWDPALPFLYESGSGKKAIVVGATAGMGRETARLLAADGYTVGCVGRRTERLKELKKELGDRCVPRSIDVSKEKCMQQVRDLIQDMGGCDLMMISVSCAADKWRHHGAENGREQKENEWPTINVDQLGFWRAALVALEHFEQKGRGHLVGVSSTSGLIGEAGNPAYSGVKAFMQRYLEGVRNYMLQNNIAVDVTDIVPGFVDNDWVAPGEWDGEYWATDAKTAGRQIFHAIKSKKWQVFVTKRWRIISWLYRLVPTWLYNRLGGF